MGQTPSTVPAPTIRQDHPRQCRSAWPLRRPASPAPELPRWVILALPQPSVQEAATTDTSRPASVAVPPPLPSSKLVPSLSTTPPRSRPIPSLPTTSSPLHCSNRLLLVVPKLGFWVPTMPSSPISILPSLKPLEATVPPSARKSSQAPSSLICLSRALAPPLTSPSEPILEEAPVLEDRKRRHHEKASSSTTRSTMLPFSPDPLVATDSPVHSSSPQPRQSPLPFSSRPSLETEPPIPAEPLLARQPSISIGRAKPTRSAKGRKCPPCGTNAPSSSRDETAPVDPVPSPPPLDPTPLASLSAAHSSSPSSPSSQATSPDYTPPAQRPWVHFRMHKGKTIPQVPISKMEGFLQFSS